MSSIDDTDMSIFHSPPRGAKHRGGVRHETSRATFAGGAEEEDGTHPDDRVPPREEDDDDEDEIMYSSDTTYLDILQQAAEWKTALQLARDDLFRLQIRAAVTLDQFSMLAPELQYVPPSPKQQQQQQQQQTDDATATTAVEPHNLADTFDKAEEETKDDDGDAMDEEAENQDSSSSA